VLDRANVCWFGICVFGLTLDQLADVGRAQGLRATVVRDLTPDAFRDLLRSSNNPSRRLIVNSTERLFSAPELDTIHL